MSQSGKTAVGGMITALSVVILMPTALEIFVYALPAMAGMLVMFSVIELDKKWAFGIYAAVSILSLMLVPNKEAAVLYTAFFGYYPILKAVLESRLPKVPEYILKFAVFNVSMLASYAVLIKVLGMPFDELMGLEGETGFLAEYMLPVVLILGNITFAFFDIALTRIVTTYLRVWQKKFRKLFPFK
ncbi:MAG: hypothetical protein IJN88_07470 [Clostridia bacterium]|nr:hypothetical protein [Clostridia bacterium]